MQHIKLLMVHLVNKYVKRYSIFDKDLIVALNPANFLSDALLHFQLSKKEINLLINGIYILITTFCNKDAGESQVIRFSCKNPAVKHNDNNSPKFEDNNRI